VDLIDPDCAVAAPGWPFAWEHWCSERPNQVPVRAGRFAGSIGVASPNCSWSACLRWCWST